MTNRGSYYRGAHGIIVVYDVVCSVPTAKTPGLCWKTQLQVTDKESFNNVKHWVQDRMSFQRCKWHQMNTEGGACRGRDAAGD